MWTEPESINSTDDHYANHNPPQNVRQAVWYYKIIEPLRALSLVDRCVKMRVCKHDCDDLDSCVFERNILKKQ